MPKKLYAIGVGPGSPKYLTDAAKEALHKCHYVVGYKYTLTTIESVIDRSNQEVFEVTMKNQEDVYQSIHKE